MHSTCAKLLRWRRYFGLCSTQALHTYSLSQLQPSHVYWSRNSHPKVDEIDVYTPGLENWLLVCSQLVPNCFNDAGILDSAVRMYHTYNQSPNCSHRMCTCRGIGIQKSLKLTFIHPGWRFDCFHAVNLCFDDAGIVEYALHRYPTHIQSPICCRRMCIRQATNTEKSLKSTFIHSGSRFDCFYALNLFQNASMMLVFWIVLYTCISHIFSLPTTTIACVFDKQ